MAIFAYSARNKAGDLVEAEAFKANWMEQRATALEKAGFDPIWR